MSQELEDSKQEASLFRMLHKEEMHANARMLRAILKFAKFESVWHGGSMFEDDLPSMSDTTFDHLHSHSRLSYAVRVYPKLLVEALCDVGGNDG